MPNRLDLEFIDWIARIGAATSEDVATALGQTEAHAHRRLLACARAGLLNRVALLRDHPELFTARRAGLCLVGREELGCARVSASSFEHWRACASVAALLEREHPGRVGSDLELRAREREDGKRIASAEMGLARRTGEPATHRPDLVLWAAGPGLPRAIEVELAVKSPRRLERIVRAWARTRTISGVTYYAAPRAQRAVGRAIAAMRAQDIVEVLPLPSQDPVRTIPSSA